MTARALPLAVAVAALLALGCAGARSLPQSPQVTARPEPDPACRGMVREALGRNGLERVVVKFAYELHLHPAGAEVELVDFLTPDLTPVAKTELARAFSTCVWAPLPRDQGHAMWTTEWLREAAR